MSTKSTLYSPATDDSWWLQEEMLDETVQWVVEDPAIIMSCCEVGARFTITIPPKVLDAIAELHGKKQLPHQREREGQP